MATTSSISINAVCEKCRKVLGVEAMKADGVRLWHPDCLICCCCKNNLQYVWFVQKAKSLFCQKCYKWMYRRRCAECCQPMKVDGKLTQAMDVKFHEKCFKCHSCKIILKKDYYIMKKHAVCFKCYVFNSESVTQFDFTNNKSASDADINTHRHLVDADKTSSKASEFE